MRRASVLTTLIGTFFLAMALAAPTILRWQTEHTLGQMGASQYVDLAVSANLDRLAFDLLLTKVFSVAVLVSGVLMLRRIKQGLFLGLSAYAACFCVALYSFIVLGWAFVPLFKAAAWAYAFHYVLSAHRQSGSNWWRQSI